jgi:hypothetical protein
MWAPTILRMNELSDRAAEQNFQKVVEGKIPFSSDQGSYRGRRE